MHPRCRDLVNLSLLTGMTWYPDIQQFQAEELASNCNLSDGVKALTQIISDMEGWNYTDETGTNIIWEAGCGNYRPKRESNYILLVSHEWENSWWEAPQIWAAEPAQPLTHVNTSQGKKERRDATLLTGWGIRPLLIHDLASSVGQITMERSAGVHPIIGSVIRVMLTRFKLCFRRMFPVPPVSFLI